MSSAQLVKSQNICSLISFILESVRSGTILQLGHMDFYPDGGSVQSGCMFGIDARPGGLESLLRVKSSQVNFPGLCSHRRAVFYYYHSIREPGLFPSVACPSVEECNKEHASTDQVSHETMGRT